MAVSIDGERVYVICRGNGLFGWHMEHVRRKSQVLAFRRRPDAEAMAHRIWQHRLLRDKWPSTELRDVPQLELATNLEPRTKGVSPLHVSEFDLGLLARKLGYASAAVHLVPEVNAEQDLSGTCIFQGALVEDQVRWLQLMYRQPCAKHQGLEAG